MGLICKLIGGAVTSLVPRESIASGGLGIIGDLVLLTCFMGWLGRPLIS